MSSDMDVMFQQGLLLGLLNKIIPQEGRWPVLSAACCKGRDSGHHNPNSQFIFDKNSVLCKTHTVLQVTEVLGVKHGSCIEVLPQGHSL